MMSEYSTTTGQAVAPNDGWGDENYRTWSIPALLTGLTGVISVVSLLSTALLFLPVLTLLLGLVTWWSVYQAPQRWLGLRWAWVGVLLAIYSMSTLATHLWTQRNANLATARLVAEQWLEYQRQGEPLLAFDLTRATNVRFLSTSAMQDYLANNQKDSERRNEQLASEPYATLERVGPTLKWEPTTSQTKDSSEDVLYFTVNYAVKYVELTGRQQQIPLEFLIERRQFTQAEYPTWTVVRVSSAELTGPAKPAPKPSLVPL